MTALNLPVPPDVVDRVTEFPSEVLCLMTNRPARCVPRAVDTMPLLQCITF